MNREKEMMKTFQLFTTSGITCKVYILNFIPFYTTSSYRNGTDEVQKENNDNDNSDEDKNEDHI